METVVKLREAIKPDPSVGLGCWSNFSSFFGSEDYERCIIISVTYRRLRKNGKRLTADWVAHVEDLNRYFHYRVRSLSTGEQFENEERLWARLNRLAQAYGYRWGYQKMDDQVLHPYSGLKCDVVNLVWTVERNDLLTVSE